MLLLVPRPEYLLWAQVQPCKCIIVFLSFLALPGFNSTNIRGITSFYQHVRSTFYNAYSVHGYIAIII